jgi:hypothetical protein
VCDRYFGLTAESTNFLRTCEANRNRSPAVHTNIGR